MSSLLITEGIVCIRVSPVEELWDNSQVSCRPHGARCVLYLDIGQVFSRSTLRRPASGTLLVLEVISVRLNTSRASIDALFLVFAYEGWVGHFSAVHDLWVLVAAAKFAHSPGYVTGSTSTFLTHIRAMYKQIFVHLSLHGSMKALGQQVDPRTLYRAAWPMSITLTPHKFQPCTVWRVLLLPLAFSVTGTTRWTSVLLPTPLPSELVNYNTTPQFLEICASVYIHSDTSSSRFTGGLFIDHDPAWSNDRCTNLTRNNRPAQIRRYLGPPRGTQLDPGANYSFAGHPRSCSTADKTDFQTVLPFSSITRA